MWLKLTIIPVETAMPRPQYVFGTLEKVEEKKIQPNESLVIVAVVWSSMLLCLQSNCIVTYQYLRSQRSKM